MIIELTEVQVDVLRFVLDCTEEEWGDNMLSQVLGIAEDPSIEVRADLGNLKQFFADLRELLETAGSLNNMNEIVKQIREKLVPNDLVGSAA